jgi:hypothetical protein
MQSAMLGDLERHAFELLLVSHAEHDTADPVAGSGVART